MARWKVVCSAVLGVLVVTAATAAAIGPWVWYRGTARAVSRLDPGESGHPEPDRPAAAESCESLPAPVQRYLRFALPERPQRIRKARVEWSGQFQMRPGAGWVRFTANQNYTTDLPGFVWDARVHLWPIVPLRVRDGYWQGTGSMLARLAGVVPVVDNSGTPEMAQSALARWLGETVWFPTALLPGGPVRWNPVDDSTAIATVSDGAVRATAEFHFGPTGEVTRISALRYRDVDGTAVLIPFEARMWNYAPQEGIMVPNQAEVAWIPREGRFPYWRGTPERIEYAVEPAEASAGPR